METSPKRERGLMSALVGAAGCQAGRIGSMGHAGLRVQRSWGRLAACPTARVLSRQWLRWRDELLGGKAFRLRGLL